jgi:hypothetical protein
MRIENMGIKKVTGIGGIFFKCDDPDKIKEWYAKHLGLVTNEYGSVFEFRHTNKPEHKGYLNWSPFKKDTSYIAPSTKGFMINYRVENLEDLLAASLRRCARMRKKVLEGYSVQKSNC